MGYNFGYVIYSDALMILWGGFSDVAMTTIFLAFYSVSTKKRPPKYNGLVFELLGKHH